MKCDTVEERPKKMFLREMILLSLLSVAAVVARHLLRIPVKIPGHAYAVYILLLVFGSSYVSRRGAATYMGITAGIFGIVTVSDTGILVFFRYLLPAVVVEAARRIPRLFHPVINRIIEGLLASWVMLIVKSVINLIIGVPVEIVAVKMYPGVVTYTAFGIGAGIGAHLLARSLKAYSRRGTEALTWKNSRT